MGGQWIKSGSAGIVSVADHEWGCLFIVCIFWTGPITSYLVFNLTQCMCCHYISVTLHSMENQVRATWCYGLFSLSYSGPHTHPRKQYLFTLSISFSPSLRSPLLLSFCVLCNVLSSRTISNFTLLVLQRSTENASRNVPFFFSRCKNCYIYTWFCLHCSNKVTVQ